MSNVDNVLEKSFNNREYKLQKQMASAICPLGTSLALMPSAATMNRLGLKVRAPIRLGNTVYGTTIASRNVLGGNARRSARILAGAKVGIMCSAAPVVEVRLGTAPML